MTISQFRKMALSLPEVEERSHMGHPDFRAGGKIFATLGSPDKAFGMVKLTPDEQQMYIQAHPKVFIPANGGWGRGGSTLVQLKDADPDVVGEAMHAAWRGRTTKTAPKKSRPS